MVLPLICLMTTLPALQTPVQVNAGQAVLDAARAKAKSVMVARAAHISAGKNTRDFRGDCSRELADLDVRLATEKHPEVRQALLVSKLFHLQLAKLEPAAAFLAQVRLEVPPTASAWSLDPGLLTARAEEDPAGWGAYVAEVRTRHGDASVRSALLFDFFWDRLEAKDEAMWKPAYDRLQTEFGSTRQARQAKDILESDQKTGLGRPAPAFSLQALDAANTTYSLDSFKGRYLLIDFWATWCPPCRAEMPNLHAAWAKFKGKPFDLLSLSFDRKVEHIAPFREQAATPMPWKHAFIAGGFQNPIAVAYGVKGIPKPLLIGPDGTIVASGADLRGTNLEKTLATFLGR